MFTVQIKGQEFKANEEVAMTEWYKGAKVFSAEGFEVQGTETGVTGEFFIYN
jgi:hypothetical protein